MSEEPQDDEYAINLALSCFRDAINDADADSAMTVVHEIFTWMCDGEPSFWGVEGRRAAQAWVRRAIAQNAQIKFTPINARVIGNFAFATGWETLEFPGANGEPLETTHRYFQTWEKAKDGQWRMSSFICNRDVAPAMLEEQT